MQQLKNFRVLIFLLISTLFIASCKDGTQPNDNISFGHAFRYCTSLFWYWFWVVIAVVLGGGGIYFGLWRNYQKKQDWSGGHSVVLFIIVALIFAAFLATPASVAANTTVEQAARGVYIR